MRGKLVLTLLLPTVLLAGCAEPPLGDAEAAHANAACPPAAFVNGFRADGAPECVAPANPLAGFSCAEGEVVTGFDAEGAPVCADLMALAQKSMEKNAPPPAQPAKSLSLTSAGALQGGVKSYVISSASPMKWGDLLVTLDGAPRRLDAEGTCPSAPAAGAFLACGAERKAGADAVTAGDTFAVGGLRGGETLRILDAQANAVILTLVVG